MSLIKVNILLLFFRFVFYLYFFLYILSLLTLIMFLPNLKKNYFCSLDIFNDGYKSKNFQFVLQKRLFMFMHARL